MSITVTRAHRPYAHFTQISNHFLRYPMPANAFRVGCFLLSHEAGYVMTQERIAEALGISRNTVIQALRKLDSLGFARTQEVRDEKGYKVGSRIEISDTGFDIECSETEHRDGSNVQKLNKACSKIEQHKKTNLKNTKEIPGSDEPTAMDVGLDPELSLLPAGVPVGNGVAKTGRRKPKIPIPVDWLPTDKHQESAHKRGVHLQTEAEKFRLHAEANDRRQSDWDAAFGNWLISAEQFAARRGTGGRQTNVDRKSGIMVER